MKRMKVGLSLLCMLFGSLFLNSMALAQTMPAGESQLRIVRTSPDGKTAAEEYGEDEVVAKFVLREREIGSAVLNRSEVLRVIIQFQAPPILIARMQGGNIYAPQQEFDDFLADLARIEAEIQEQSGGKYPKVRTVVKRQFQYAFNGASAEATRQVIEEIKNLPYVIAVHDDGEVQATLAESVPLIQADAVWNGLGARGEGILVSIIDTGIDYTHAALGAGFGADFRVVAGYDFYNEDSDPFDDNGHGTHVAGIVGADGPGITGVAPEVKFHAYKVLGAGGSGSFSDVIAGIERSVDPDQDPNTEDAVDIINMSLGGGGDPDDAPSQAVDNAVAAGVICVISAGNSGGYNTIGSPGTARRAITVGASTKSDQMASFSSRGPSPKIFQIKPEVTAPGVSINSTWLDGGFASLNGTSMAAPHVAGAAALLRQLHPGWSPDMIKAALMETAVDLGHDVFTQGSGRIDVYEAATTGAVITPGNLSLGLVDNSVAIWTKTETLELQNLSTAAQNYSLTISGNLPSGASASISPAQVTLNPGESASLTFEISVDNAVIPFPPGEPPAYEAAILAQSGNDELHVPFAFIKSTELQLVFDEGPWVVLIHNRSDRSWFYANPGTFLSVLLPPGVYDIITTYGDVKTRVIVENVLVEETSSISINKSDAVHQVDIFPINENGLPVTSDLGGEFLAHQNSGIGLITISGGIYPLPKFFSNTSSAYAWAWSLRSDQPPARVYQFNGSANGFSSDLVFQNTPEELKRLSYAVSGDPDDDKFFIIHWVSQGPAGGWSFASYSSSDPPLTSPFVQEAFYLPASPTDYSFRFNYKEVYKHSGSQFGDGDDEFLYRTPYLAAKDNSRVEGYLLGAPQTPVFETDSEEMPIGLSPPHWFGKFINQNSEVRLQSPLGWLVWLYTSQRSDLRPHDLLPYELYQNGSLIQSGNFSGVGNPGWGPFYVSLPVSPGTYTLQVPYDQYYIQGIQGSAKAAATFNTQASDKNPPYLTSLNILGNGELTDVIEPFIHTDKRIEFTMTDEVSLNSASLFYREDTAAAWKPLALGNAGNLYSAVIPDTLQGHISLQVAGSDNQGNSLSYEMRPAFYIKPVETGPQIAVLPETINFGTTMVGEISAPATVTIYSVGTSDLTVTGISNPGQQFILSDVPSLPVQLAPGATAQFTVAFAPQAPGAIEKAVTISSNDFEDPDVNLSLSGIALVDGVALAFSSLRIQDYYGNEDGIANGGEQMALPAKLHNNGTDEALDVQAVITSASPYVNIFGNTANFGNIATGESQERYGWYAQITEGTPENTDIDFTVTITASNAGPFTDSFTITTGPPLPAGGPFALENVTVDDSPQTLAEAQAGFEQRTNDIRNLIRQPGIDLSFVVFDTSHAIQRMGNGDGIINGGEIIDLLPTIRNDGADAFYVQVTAQTNSPYVSFFNSGIFLGTVQSGQSVTADYPWTFGLNLGTPAGTEITFQVTVYQAIGENYTTNFTLTTGPPLSLPPAAAPGVLFGSTSWNPEARLLNINPQTGASSVVGDIGVNAVYALASNSSGELFGVAYGYTLLRLNPATGAGLFVSRFRDSSNNFVSSIEALAFNPNDELYAIRRSVSTPNLYQVNIQHGAMALVGSTGVSELLGMSFDPTSGVLYASRGATTDEVYTVDVATGAATLLGTTGFNTSIQDLAFDQTGVLYGVTWYEGPAPWSLITIDKGNGAGTLVGSLGETDVYGLTFVPPRQSGAQILVHPQTLDFGNVLVGESSPPLPITIRNVGTTDLTVTAISDPGLPFVLYDVPDLPLVLNPESEIQFSVVFSPTGPGSEGTIVITSDDADDPQVEVALVGHGIVPGVALAFSSLRIQDYYGNEDGIANGGEQMALPAKLHNNGTDEALDVQAVITSASPYVNIFGNTANFGNIATGESQERYGWYAQITEGTPENTDIDFTVTITASNAGPFTDSFTITTGPPLPPGGPFVLENVAVDDSPQTLAEAQASFQQRTGDVRGLTRQPGIDLSFAVFDTSHAIQRMGNGDGIINGGEIIDLLPTIRNDGADAFGVQVYASTSSPHVSFFNSWTFIGTLLSGQSVTANYPWTFGLNLGTPPGTEITFQVTVYQAIGESYTTNFTLTTGPSLSLPPAAAPGVLFGSTSWNPEARLLNINPQTGSSNVVGDIGVNSVYAVAANSSGELFSVAYGYTLLRLNPATGAGLFVSRFRDAINESYIYDVEALAFNGEDELYAIRRPSFAPYLYRVNIETGVMTLVGSTGVSDLLGMSFDPSSGVLFASRGSTTDEVYTVDVATGAAALLGTTGFNTSIQDIAFDQSGVLYGVTWYEGSAPRSLITIDKATGAGALVGSIGNMEVYGLTFTPPRASGAQILVHPATIDFGNVLVGESSPPITVTVRNVGTADLTVTGISEPGLPFVLQDVPALPLVLNPESEIQFTVVFSPTGPGSEGTIVITSDDADDPQVEVALVGHGIVPGVALAFSSLRIQDFYGNEDGIANGGEQMDWPAKVRNNGADEALDVQAVITSTSPYVSIYGNTANFGNIPTGESEERYGWYGEIAEGTPEGTEIEFTVTITASNAGPFTDSFTITTGPPLPPGGPFVLEDVAVDDSPQTLAEAQAGFEQRTGDVRNLTRQPGIDLSFVIFDTSHAIQRMGNGDGVINGGEIIDLLPTIRNDGADAYYVQVTAQTNSPYASFFNSGIFLGTLLSGQSVTAGYPWTFGLNLGTPPGTEITFQVTIYQAIGENYTTNFTLTTGPPLSLPPVAAPGVLYGSTSWGEGARLLNIDPATGASTVVGMMGLDAVYAVAANSSGELFGMGYGYALLRLNPNNGAGLFVNRLRDAVNGSSVSSVEALAFDSEDKLYAIRRSSFAPNLYRVNVETGATTTIGSTGVPNLLGMSFDPTSGVLYASRGSTTDEVYTVDVATGAAALLGMTGFNTSIQDLAFDQSGVLYGVTWYEGPAPRSLITIDKTTGAGTLVGSFGNMEVYGLTFTHEAAACVSYDFPVQTGAWYLISLPVVPEDNSVTTLFPGAVGAFGWNYASQNYSPATHLEPGKGYWLLMLQAQTVEVCGEPFTAYTHSYATQGWDLTGSVIATSPLVDDPEESIISMFGWNPVNGQYTPISPQVTEPKQGYWILVFQTPSTVTVGGAGVSGTVAKTAAGVATPAFFAKYGSAPPPPPYAMAGNQLAPIPESYGLSQNFPNPFNPETRIEYQMPEAGKVSLTIYNTLGQSVRRLVNGEKSAGFHHATWDGKNDAGQALPTGMYLYRLETTAFKETRKILLLR